MSSPRVSNNSLLKYRRQFCIRNPILFLNYSNNFYIFFLSCTFVSGTLPYYLFFLHHFTFRLGTTPKHVTLRRMRWFFGSPKRLGEWIRSCWREIFSHLTKNQRLGRDLESSWRYSYNFIYAMPYPWR